MAEPTKEEIEKTIEDKGLIHFRPSIPHEEIKIKDLKDVIYYAIINPLQTNYDGSNRMQCSAGRRRSVGDIYWIAKKYIPGITLEAVQDCLNLLGNNDVIETHYCGIVKKEVNHVSINGYACSLNEFRQNSLINSILPDKVNTKAKKYTNKKYRPVPKKVRVMDWA